MKDHKLLTTACNCLTCTKPMEMVTRPLSSTSNTLQQIQYLNYITGIPVLYKILKKNHNTGTNFYTSIVHNTSIPVLRSPSTGDPWILIILQITENTASKIKIKLKSTVI